jgi:hypothetical protein
MALITENADCVEKYLEMDIDDVNSHLTLFACISDVKYSVDFIPSCYDVNYSIDSIPIYL